MKKRTKILVPIDFSNCSENALAYALKLADKIDATVEVLHVAIFDAPPLDYPSFVAVATDEKIKMARKRMNDSITGVRKEISEFIDSFPDVQTDIEVGVPDTKIVEISLRDQVDFIVMGTQGKHSRWDRLLGSTASDVLKYAECPVFVIPEKAKFQEKMVVGYATDFSDADPFEIWKTSKLLQPMQTKIVVVHLNDQKEFLDDKIEVMESFFNENASEMNISFFNIKTSDMVNDLINFIENHNINIMVMYKPKRNYFERLFYKSFTKEMTYNTEVPLLILKET